MVDGFISCIGCVSRREWSLMIILLGISTSDDAVDSKMLDACRLFGEFSYDTRVARSAKRGKCQGVNKRFAAT